MKTRLSFLFSLFLFAVRGLAQPVITQQPVSVATTTGATATFKVGATGSAPPSFQWRLNGNNLPGATASTLTITGVQYNNCGSYDAVVYSAAGITNSATVSLTLTDLQVLPLADKFANAGTLGFTTYGMGTGSNTLATVEPGEPNPDGIPGGASVWLTWISPYNGVTYMSTAGSGFDTLLAVYTGTSLTKLTPVIADDDAGGFLCSTVTFSAKSNVTYYVQIDGAYGAKGNIVLYWYGVPVPVGLQPSIVQQPQPRTTASFGSTVTLSVTTQTAATATNQWYFNGKAISRAINTNLVLANLSPAQLGVYTVTISDPAAQDSFPVTSEPAIVEVNGTATTGQTDPNAFADDKFRFETDTNNIGLPLGPDGNNSGNAAPASGFTGTQIFNTYGATKDPGEPNPCGELGGASVWFSYQAPASGPLTIDTIGSTFPNVIGVYTGPGDSYATLEPVTCADTNHSPGGEVVSLEAVNGTIYYIVVDGIGGVTGTVNLDYSLQAAAFITNQPVSQTFSNGVNATLTVGASGTPGLHYQWRFDGTNIPGATLSSFTRADFQATNQGNYTVVVTNNSGSVTSSVAALYLNTPLRLTNPVFSAGSFRSTLLGVASTNYVIQTSTNLTNWTPLLTNSSPVGILNFTNAALPSTKRRFYRAYNP